MLGVWLPVDGGPDVDALGVWLSVDGGPDVDAVGVWLPPDVGTAVDLVTALDPFGPLLALELMPDVVLAKREYCKW